MGGFIAFLLVKKQVKQSLKLQLKSGVPEEDLVAFRFTSAQYNNLHWVKKDKEFKWINSMYDVVSRTEENGIIFLSCINDTKETELFKQLDQLIELNIGKANNSSSNKSTKTIQKFASKLFCEALTKFTLHLPIENRQLFFHYAGKSSIAFPTKVYSPPKF